MQYYFNKPKSKLNGQIYNVTYGIEDVTLTPINEGINVVSLSHETFRRFVDKKHYVLTEEGIRKTEENRIRFMTTFACVFAAIAKAIFIHLGHDVDFRINGEDIDFIKNLDVLDIQQRMDLAIKEERFEDAAKLRDTLRQKRILLKEQEKPLQNKNNP